MKTLVLIAFAMSFVLTTGGAHADGIEVPPMKCPPGAEVAFSHGGVWCAPTTCTDDARCKTGSSCVEQGLCVETYTYEDTRAAAPRPKKTAVKADVVCGPGGVCSSGTCEKARRCVPGVAKKCGCAAAGDAIPLGGIVIAAVVLSRMISRRTKRQSGAHLR
jgi:hypothetical protein